MTKLKEGLVLYHGSYCVVDNPDLQKCAVYKDFGQGFYLTTSKEQAKSFAKLTASKRIQQGILSEKFAYVSFFKVTNIDDITSYVYENADAAWLHCVVAHRRKNAFEELAEEEKKSTDEVLLSFMGSNTGKMLYNDSTKLWWDGPTVVAEEYKKEMSL